jgi:hypothetical protein
MFYKEKANVKAVPLYVMPIQGGGGSAALPIVDPGARKR